MSLELTPVHRNLHTKVTFLGLEFEDLILVLALAALMNLLAHFVSGNVHVFGMPLNIFMEFVVPALAVPCLILFKYGRPADISQTWCVRSSHRRLGARLSEIPFWWSLILPTRRSSQCGPRSGT